MQTIIALKKDRFQPFYNQGCRLCPRECGADRIHGQTGFCGMTDELMAARAALHYWEEPSSPGQKGLERYSFPVVHFDVCFVRMPRLLQVMLERCCLWIAWQTFFWSCRRKKQII